MFVGVGVGVCKGADSGVKMSSWFAFQATCTAQSAATKGSAIETLVLASTITTVGVVTVL